MLKLDGRIYDDEFVIHPTGRPNLPYVMLAVDGSGVFVVRSHAGQTSVHRTDRPGLEALAASLDWPWLLPAAGPPVDDET